MNRPRLAVAGLALAAAALFETSLHLPWWTFKLYAPQYPSGLTLVVSLRGMGGDVHEIDLLNHYIGMARLAEAAPLERTFAAWGVAVVAVTTVLGLVGATRRWNALVALPAVFFPIAFLADSIAWLHRFGHHLDPKAPIKLGSFTPQMFGNGTIGQFDTFAQPSLGFWLAIAGVACAVAATFVRIRVPAACPERGVVRALLARLTPATREITS